MQRVKFDVVKATVKRALLNAGLDDKKADICAQIHTESSCDGVYSHGLNRVSRFVDYVRKGWIDILAEPTLVKASGVIEIYDGNQGVGITNALFASKQAARIARENGIGVVALRNTTHWMRGGTYGWKMAEQGLAAICWTNTESCMPAWSAKNTRVGNNPFVMAVPRENGPLVLDMAMSQYSYGKLQTTRLKNERLPFPGGYDKNGNLTDNPGPIEQSMRILPAGYWKGSGLAILLDAMAALLSAGNSTGEIDNIGKGSCTGASQIFIVFDPNHFGEHGFNERLADNIANYVKTSEPGEGQAEVCYPGERTLRTRRENLLQGIPVDTGVWEELQKIAN